MTAQLIEGTAIVIGSDKPGDTVVDLGIHRGGNDLCGDLDTTAVADVASTITAVSGGWNR